MTKQPEQIKKEKPKLNVGFGIGLGEYTAAIVVGIASGILTAGKTIRDKFHEDVKHSADIGDKLKEHAQALKKVKIPDDTPPAEAGKVYARLIREMKKEQMQEIDTAIVSKRFISNTLIKGTIERAGLMSRRSVNSILLRSAIGIAVGAGAMLSFFNGIATRAKIEAIDNAVESDLANQPDDQKPLAFKDRKPLPPKALPKNDDKTADHAEKVAAEAATGKPVKDLREKYEELKEERPVSHVERVGEPVKEEHVGKPASHVEKLAAAADAQDLQVAAR